MRKLCFVLSFISLFSCVSNAQWNQHYFRGYANIFYADNQQLFAAVDSSLIYRSTDQGATWQPVNAGLPGGALVMGFGLRGNVLVAACDGGAPSLRGVFRSTNLGQAWSQVAGLPDQNFRYLHLIDSTWFASLYTFSGGPLYYSTNNGANWTLATGLTDKRSVPSMVRLNSAGTQLLASTEGGLVTSTNGGAAWQIVSATGLPALTVFKKLVTNGSGLILGYTNSYSSQFLYSSTNAGVTWSAVTPAGLPANALMYDLTQYGTDLYGVVESTTLAVKTKRLYKSNSFGASWTEIPTSTLGMIADKKFNCGSLFALSGTNMFAAADGIFKSTNSGTNWTEASSGIRYNALVNAAASTSGGLFLLANNNLYQTSVYPGTPAMLSSFPLRGSYRTGLLANNNVLFAGNDQLTVRTTNSGTSWDTVRTPFPLTINNMFSGNSKLYLYGNRTSNNTPYILSSTNNGTSWDTVKISLSNVYFSSLNAVYNKVYASAYNKVYETTNLSDWTEYPLTGLPVTNFGPSFPADTNKFVLMVNTGGVKAFMYYTTNKGVSWNKAAVTGGAVSGDSIPIVTSFLRVAGNVLAGTNKGVFISTNFGQSWAPYSTGMGAVPVLHLYNTGKYVIASTQYYSAWFIPSGTVDVEEHALEQRAGFRLAQNYPNPFNPVTTINYSITAVSAPSGKTGTMAVPVSLKVYDLLGSVVATLVEQEQAPGAYTVRFDASRLASGTYFYELRAGDYRSVKKLTVLK